MNKLKITLILLIILSCSVTKERRYTKTELTTIIDSVKVNTLSKSIDTIKVYKDRVITKEVKSVVKVNIDCDSLGNVKNIDYGIQSGNNRFKARIKDNKLSLSINIDSVVNVTKELYRSKYRQDSISLVQSLRKEHSKTEDKLIVKELFSLFKNWKLYLIIVFLGFVIFKIIKK